MAPARQRPFVVSPYTVIARVRAGWPNFCDVSFHSLSPNELSWGRDLVSAVKIDNTGKRWIIRKWPDRPVSAREWCIGDGTVRESGGDCEPTCLPRMGLQLTAAGDPTRPAGPS
jgi:hypothetical protein